MRLEAYVGSVRDSLATVSPPLSQGQIEAVLSEIRAAWDKLWFPPSDDTAPSFRHTALLGAERVETISRLGRIAVAGGRLLQFLQEINAHETEIVRLEDETNRIEAVGPGIEEKRKRLIEVQGQLGPLNQRGGALRSSRDALEGQLSAKRAALAHLRQQVANSAPGQKRAAAAARVAQMIDAILSEAVPGEVGAVAEAMTDAFRAMSHKGLVDRVTIAGSVAYYVEMA